MGGVGLGKESVVGLFEHHFDGSPSVSEELGVDSFEGGVPLSALLFDAVSVGFESLVVVGVVGLLCHI